MTRSLAVLIAAAGGPVPAADPHTLTPPLGLETAAPYNSRWRVTAAKGE